ncbi:MAG: GNAT family N-acetyltransferase [Deltaproteobacteria bacterium]|nr:GNAT family N-acetyltransferase [Deltaproteobacteria bacterium]MBW2361978.1 GNAT family N-acetyltransferase [Deltaproteobacteria bacterium]
MALWRELMRHHAPLDPQYDLVPGAAAAWRVHLAGLLGGASGAVFVSGEEGAPGAFCSVELRPAPPLLSEPGRAEITDLFVSPALRRNGCGRALVEAALVWIRERGIARVEVRVVAANRDGQAFWRALGWGDFVDVLQRRL